MTPERRLDRLENIVKLMIKAGRRERKETREKINALIDAQMRTEKALTRFARSTEEEMSGLAREQAKLARAQEHTEEKLGSFITNTEESLRALIATVDRVARERGNGKE